MKTFLFSVAMMAMALTASAQDLNLTLGEIEVDADSYYTLPVDLDNSMEIVAWSMTVYSPAELILEEVGFSDRYETYGRNKTPYHGTTLTKTSDGGVLITCYAGDVDHRVIAGNSGRLCDLVFNGEKFTGANPEIRIEKFSVSQADGSQINWDGFITTSIEFVPRNMNVNADGTIYNLSGQRVEKASKGLYIKNGQKVVVK